MAAGVWRRTIPASTPQGQGTAFMSQTEPAAQQVVRRYYEAFNAGDRAGMLALLTEDVVHDVNQGPRETGKAAFAAFLGKMDQAYRERLVEIVVMVDASGTRA